LGWGGEPELQKIEHGMGKKTFIVEGHIKIPYNIFEKAEIKNRVTPINIAVSCSQNAGLQFANLHKFASPVQRGIFKINQSPNINAFFLFFTRIFNFYNFFNST
jgi:hypothetical protein